MTLLASLPMYDWPELQSATDAFWTFLKDALQEQGFAAPIKLDRRLSLLSQWQSDDLLLSQTCGSPLTSCLRGAVKVVGTPHYDATGCEGPDYSSFLVVRKDSNIQTLACLAGRRAAFNDRGSLSGHSAFCAVIGPLARGQSYFSSVMESGSHRRSIEFVASGQVDAACIDAVCWQYAQSLLPELTDLLKPIGATPKMPGLPFITAGGRSSTELSRIQDAIEIVLGNPATAQTCRQLRITGFSRTDESDYLPVSEMHEGSIKLNYRQLW